MRTPALTDGNTNRPLADRFPEVLEDPAIIRVQSTTSAGEERAEPAFDACRHSSGNPMRRSRKMQGCHLQGAGATDFLRNRYTAHPISLRPHRR